MRSALYVASAVALLATICCAFCAFAWWKVSATATSLRSMSSTLAELHEIRDYLQKIDAWSKRINSRLVMQERRESPMNQGISGVTDKAELRRLAGIVPGRPAPHRGA
jgi:hypothetical protein